MFCVCRRCSCGEKGLGYALHVCTEGIWWTGTGGRFRPGQPTAWSGECLSVSPHACIILCVHMFVSLRALLDTCTPLTKPFVEVAMAI